jgi:hypothetical protein
MSRFFECPLCHAGIRTRGKEVGHRCSMNKSKWVNWKEVTDEAHHD